MQAEAAHNGGAGKAGGQVVQQCLDSFPAFPQVYDQLIWHRHEWLICLGHHLQSQLHASQEVQKVQQM